MKKVCIAFLVLLLCLSMAAPAFGVPDLPRLVDDADLLTDSQEAAICSQLDEISLRQKLDVVIVTADTLGGKSPMAYADDFFDYNNYGQGAGYDGVLLLVSMEDRDWWISTCGYGITAFTDAGIEYLSEQFLDELSDGDYAQAFEIYADTCDEMIAQARSGNPYDTRNLPREPFPFLKNLMVCVGIGFVIALIVTGIMKGQLKSVRAKSAAGDYVKQGSLNVTHKQDLFLYRNIQRREKPKDSGGSGTHRSSSGRSHGGGGGKF